MVHIIGHAAQAPIRGGRLSSNVRPRIAERWFLRFSVASSPASLGRIGQLPATRAAAQLGRPVRSGATTFSKLERPSRFGSTEQ